MYKTISLVRLVTVLFAFSLNLKNSLRRQTFPQCERFREYSTKSLAGGQSSVARIKAYSA